jgi:hypothetical protein
VTQLSPEQWRILDHLFYCSLHVVRPKLTHVRKAQKVTDDELLDLIARGLIIPLLSHEEIPGAAGQLPRVLQSVLARHIRLRLSRAGLNTVLDDPGNQIRWMLGQHHGPISLARLFHGNTIAIDDVIDVQRRGLISVELPDLGEFDLTASVVLFGEIFQVTLTPKGREYLPL